MAVAKNRFVNVSEQDIEKIYENAVPQKTKQATKFGIKLFQGKHMFKNVFKPHFCTTKSNSN